MQSLIAKVVIAENFFFSACYMFHPFQIHTDFITLRLHLVYLFLIYEYLAMLLVTQTRGPVVK